MFKRFLYPLVEPKSASEDERRQEFILNTLLMGVLALSFTALVQVSIGSFLEGATFEGAPVIVVLLVIGFLLGLYTLSRQGHPRAAATLFIISFTAIPVATALTWGIGLPAGALLFVLVIVMSGTLAGTRFSLVMIGVISAIILVLAHLESQGITHPNLGWMGKPGTLNDAFGYIFIWGIIMLVSWLSNREIERSLARVRASETDLARQRDLLEIRVEERTRELKQAQLEKILQLNRFADFGRISAGFFHDIINPLTAVSLNLEQLSTKKRSELLKQAIQGVKHIENFAIAARKQVQGHNDLKLFSPAREIKEVVAILENKARAGKVTVSSTVDEEVRLYGSPIKFHQMVSNLLANAIDAYDDSASLSRSVAVTGVVRGETFELKVRDHGVGIRPEHREVIFDPFFSTKPIDKGTGIGLLIVKRIAEENFYGSISVTSSHQRGTTFTIKLPLAPS